MPDLLLELGTEELPARFIGRALKALEKNALASLKEAGLAPAGVKVAGTPRRLSLHASGIADKQADRVEEKTGPAKDGAFKDGKPTIAATKFAESFGLTVEQLETREVTKKGKTREYLYARREVPGRIVNIDAGDGRAAAAGPDKPLGPRVPDELGVAGAAVQTLVVGPRRALADALVRALPAGLAGRARYGDVLAGVVVVGGLQVPARAAGVRGRRGHPRGVRASAPRRNRDVLGRRGHPRGVRASAPRRHRGVLSPQRAARAGLLRRHRHRRGVPSPQHDAVIRGRA